MNGESELLRENARLLGELVTGLVVLTWVAGLGFVAIAAILLFKLT